MVGWATSLHATIPGYVESLLLLILLLLLLLLLVLLLLCLWLLCYSRPMHSTLFQAAGPLAYEVSEKRGVSENALERFKLP